MRVTRTIILTCLLLFSATSLSAIDETNLVPKRNLFVGNSFSFYNNGIHNHYSNLIRVSGQWQRGKNYNRLSTLSGGSLLEHEADLESILSSAKRKYDAVILQGHSMESTDPKRLPGFNQGVRTLVKIAKQHNAKPILFMTWGYKGNKEMAEKVAASHSQLGKQIGITVVPVGLAFAHVEAEFSSIDLFIPDVSGIDDNGQITFRKDWKHPSIAGTYLVACVFYASLESKSPEGLLYTASLDRKTALQLQKIAWQVVQNYKRK